LLGPAPALILGACSCDRDLRVVRGLTATTTRPPGRRHGRPASPRWLPTPHSSAQSRGKRRVGPEIDGRLRGVLLSKTLKRPTIIFTKADRGGSRVTMVFSASPRLIAGPHPHRQRTADRRRYTVARHGRPSIATRTIPADRHGLRHAVVFGLVLPVWEALFGSLGRGAPNDERRSGTWP